MIPTTEASLHDLFTEAIRGMSPRIVYEQAQGWQPYDRAVQTPGHTRRFRLVWKVKGPREGGIFTTRVYECESSLIVRTDYSGDHSQHQHAVADDYMQLLETLSALKGPSTGVMLIEPLGSPSFDYGDDSSDSITVDHEFNVRFLRER